MKKFIFFLFAFATVFTSCSKDDDDTDRDSSGDKVYSVSIKLSAAEMEKSFDRIFAQTDSTKVGKGGVRLLYDHVSLTSLAYDLACPIEWNENEINRVEAVQIPGAFVGLFQCNKCHSLFVRSNGVAYGGKAKEQNKNLKRYQVVKQSDGSSLITN